jgi:hypothetical protein
MKLNRFTAAALTLITVMATLPAVAGAGSPHSRSIGYGGYGAYGGAQGRYVGAPYRIYPDENRYGRSYYYEDPSTGRRDQYLSNLTACYDEPGHQPLVYMIDIRTGWVINTYARERGRWCQAGSGLVSLAEYGGPRRGYHDRGDGPVGYWNR